MSDHAVSNAIRRQNVALEQLQDKAILVTGGTGSFGQAFAAFALRNLRPRRLVILSRDELKQHEMRAAFPVSSESPIRYFLGDVRDRERLYRALDGVDIVVHAAALKQVPACEYNPLEAIRTNVLGAANLIDAAIDRGVWRVIALSTDKAVNPINLYGATKLCSDKLFVAANHYSGAHHTRFSVVRYGNVVGSRGSVVPVFQRLKATGTVPITDERMTRFWLTIQQGVDFVVRSLIRMNGGEIFVPKIPSIRIVDLARAIAPDCDLQVVGIRPGEKIHEVLLTEDDAGHALEFDDHYAILPMFEGSAVPSLPKSGPGVPCQQGFRYSSDANTEWLTVDQLRAMIPAPSTANEPAGQPVADLRPS